MTSSQSSPGDRLMAGLPRKHFRCILTDVPWHFKPYKPPAEDALGRRDTERHYDTMSIDEIKALPVGEHAARDCHLFFWTTGPHLPFAFQIIEAWGFKYSATAFVWAKLKKSFVRDQFVRSYKLADAFHTGMGKTTRKNVEFCLLARRGSPRRLATDVRELVIAPLREHSRKPDEVHRRIERYCDGPRLELFGRQHRPGWTCRGDEAGKFDEDAA